MEEQIKIPCVIYRGGTSKAVFVKENDLPRESVTRDTIIRAIMGGGDKREIDGLGGADILTSKFAIIGPASRDDADIDYTFAQVGIEKPWVSYELNCGNISSATGPYAIEEGFVRALEPITRVRVHNTNTRKVLVNEVPVRDRKPAVEGDYSIDGVPGTGVKIMLDYSETWGTLGGEVLPTGNVRDKLKIKNLGEIAVSIVDIANPTVFVKAEELGLKGTELPGDFSGGINSREIEQVELIREAAWKLIGMKVGTVIPFFVVVGNPASYRSFTTSESISAKDVSFVARHVGRALAPTGMHKAYAGTGSVSTSVAAMIEGTVVSDVCSDEAKETKIVRIGHPSGTIDVEAEIEKLGGSWNVRRVAYGRTARRILEGYVYVRRSIFER